jgi:hypothetical protein
MNAPLPNLDSDFDLLSMRDVLSQLDALSEYVKRRAASSKEDEIVSVKAAAEITGLSIDTIRRRIKANPALGVAIGKRYYVHVKALVEAEPEPAFLRSRQRA